MLLILKPCKLSWLPGRLGKGISANNFTAVGSNLADGMRLPVNAVRVPLVPVEVSGSKIVRMTPFLVDWLKSPARSSAVGTVNVKGKGDASFQCSYEVNVNSLFFMMGPPNVPP